MTWLRLNGFNEGEHVFQWHVLQYIMGRGKNIASLSSKLKKVLGFSANIVGRTTRKSPLGRQTPMEC